MSVAPTILERAFELAQSGEVANVHAIRKQLKAERFDSVDAHLTSQALTRQLVGLIRAAAKPDT